MLLEDDVDSCALHRLEFEFGMMGSAAAGRVKLSGRMRGWASCILLIGAILLASLPGESLAHILLHDGALFVSKRHPLSLQGAEARRL